MVKTLRARLRLASICSSIRAYGARGARPYSQSKEPDSNSRVSAEPGTVHPIIGGRSDRFLDLVTFSLRHAVAAAIPQARQPYLEEEYVSEEALRAA